MSARGARETCSTVNQDDIGRETKEAALEKYEYLVPMPPREVAWLLNMPAGQIGNTPLYLPYDTWLALLEYAVDFYAARYPALARLIEAEVNRVEGDRVAEGVRTHAIGDLYREVAMEHISNAPGWIQSDLSDSGGPKLPDKWLPPIAKEIPEEAVPLFVWAAFVAMLRDACKSWVRGIQKKEEDGYYWSLSKQPGAVYRRLDKEIDRDSSVRKWAGSPERVINEALHRAGRPANQRARLLQAISGKTIMLGAVWQWDKRLREYFKKNPP